MSHQSTNGRSIVQPALARVEGEGALRVRIDGDQVEDVQLNIYEPPRFFEGFLRGRRFTEPPDITARICGICPVAYQMSACQAIEDAIGITVDGPLRELRRLLYCGEWIESHTLHIHFLHAPDFLGYENAIDMAADHLPAVQRALELKKIGNEVLEFVGGRAIHPINVRVGGFYKVPTKREMRSMRTKLERARELAAEVVDFVATIDFADFDMPYEMVALSHPTEYAILEGRLVSDQGLDISVQEFPEHFEEIHIEHSTALHARLLERGSYLVGPLARYSLNFDRLTPLAADAAKSAGLGPTCRNPYQSIVVRAVETLDVCEVGLAIIDAYEEPDAPAVAADPQVGIGHGATEAPRGMLYHRYAVDADGLIADAIITPPTAQNQAMIENDIRRYVTEHVALDDEALRRGAEVTIRNHDPCISCATHFLDLMVVRT